MYLELNGLLEATCQDADRLNRTALNVKLGHDDFFLDRCLYGFIGIQPLCPRARGAGAEGCESRERVAGAEG